MIGRILRWLFPNPLVESKKSLELEKQRIRRINQSITPEMRAAFSRIVENDGKRESSGTDTTRSRSSSSRSSSRSDSSCTGFDD